MAPTSLGAKCITRECEFMRISWFFRDKIKPFIHSPLCPYKMLRKAYAFCARLISEIKYDWNFYYGMFWICVIFPLLLPLLFFCIAMGEIVLLILQPITQVREWERWANYNDKKWIHWAAKTVLKVIDVRCIPYCMLKVCEAIS